VRPNIVIARAMPKLATPGISIGFGERCGDSRRRKYARITRTIAIGVTV